MKVIEFLVENYKRIRVAEVFPKGHIVQITGKTGQGKTSLSDALWTGIVGRKAMPEKPVRKGATKAQIKIGLGENDTEIWIRRQIALNGNMELELEYVNENNRPTGTPQRLIDDLFNELTFDPTAFVNLPTKSRDKAIRSKIDVLKSAVKLDIDLDKLAADDAADYIARTDANKEVKRLDAVLATYTIQAGLPPNKLDEAHIMQQLANAGELNRKAQIAAAAKRDAAAAADTCGRGVNQLLASISRAASKIDDLKRQVKQAEEEFDELQEAHRKAAAEFERLSLIADELPQEHFVDVSSVTAQLQQVQSVNREIDKRDRYNAILEERAAAQKRSEALTRNIEDRAERKNAAFAAAKLPVEGLKFDEEGVTFNDIPIEQLGRAEQIKISTKLAMAMNSKLRILRIDNGESMDEDDMAVIAAMAEEHDYQLWITRVDSSGKVGIVIEDGRVKAVNDAIA